MKKLLLATILLSAPLFASAGSFTTGNAAAVGIGDQVGSSYDQLLLNGSTNIFAASPSPINVGILDFVVGFNEFSPTNSAILGSLSFDFTLNGVTQSDSLIYAWTSPDPGTIDYISFLAPDPLYYGDYLVTFLAPLTLSGNPGTYSEPLQATIVDPPRAVDEASGLFMLSLGLLMIAFGTTNTSRAYAFN